MNKKIQVLVYGYGNPGRQDDALGIVMAQKIKEWAEKNRFDNIETDTNYQLNVEDAEKISKKDVVVFVDATQENIHEFKFSRLQPSSEKVEFTMHSVSPDYVLHICNELFGKMPKACQMAVRGYRWDFQEGLTDNAKLNLEQAFQYLTRRLEQYIDKPVHYPISMLSK